MIELEYIWLRIHLSDEQKQKEKKEWKISICNVLTAWEL